MGYDRFNLKWVVYGIIDPRDHLVFYVGYTKCLDGRKMAHRPKSSCRSRFRIAELFDAGLRPVFVILEKCENEHHALRAEVFWIEMFRSRGTDLDNHPTQINSQSSPRKHAAGDPSRMHVPTPETVEKRRKAAVGRGLPEMAGQPWDCAEDERLREMFGQGADVNEISAALRRTGDGIAARLVLLGLAENRTDARRRNRKVASVSAQEQAEPTHPDI